MIPNIAWSTATPLQKSNISVLGKLAPLEIGERVEQISNLRPAN